MLVIGGVGLMSEAIDLASHYRAVRQRLEAPRPKPAQPTQTVTHPRVRTDAAVLYFTPIGPIRGPHQFDVRFRRSWEGPIELLAQESGNDIMRRFCAAHGVTVMQMCSPYRAFWLIRLRHELMWLLKRDTNLSTVQIGKLLGCRDHSTVIHGIRAHQKRIGGK